MSLSHQVEETIGLISELPDHVLYPDPAIYWSTNYVTLDFETTSTLSGTAVTGGNKLVLSCWRGPDGEIHHTRGGEYEQGELVDAVTCADFIVAHNAKFELQWLRRCGVDLRKLIVYDTQLGEYVLGGNRLRLQHLSLDATLKRYGLAPKGEVVSKMIRDGLKVENIPERWLLRYCIRDVEATHEVFLRQREALKKNNLIAIQYQRCLVSPALADIEFNGMVLDTEAVEQQEDELEKEYARLTRRLQNFCGGANPSSPKQMQQFIFGDLGFKVPRDYRGRPMLTAGGDPSVSAEVMGRLRPRTARQRNFLSLHRDWSKTNSDLTKYVRKFGECTRDSNGLLYASFNQSNTRTHRLSSTGIGTAVQFQNLNRYFKPLFRPRYDGWYIGEADGSQLEFRVAVHLGRDSVGLRDIVSGRDAHAYSASIIGVTRQEAKAHTFKPLYGGTSGSPKEREYYQAFQERYQGIFNTQTDWTHRVLKTKELTTEWGMKYYWPDTKMQESGYITNSTSIFNYPVQAFATAEIIPISLVCMWHLMGRMNSFIVNTVHDSIISEVDPNEVDTYKELSRVCLTEIPYAILQRLYGISLTVPLGAEVVLGPRWGKKETETKYSADESLWKEAATKEGMMTWIT